MAPLTKDMEDMLDGLNESNIWELKSITLPNDKNLRCADILFYGKIDFNNQEDIDLINKKRIADEDPFNLPIVYSNFDYKNGKIISNEEGIFKWYQTYDKVKILMLHHCYIGKPERIIVYKTKNVSKLNI